MTTLTTSLSERIATWAAAGRTFSSTNFEEALKHGGIDFTASLAPALATLPDGAIANVPNTNVVVGTDNKTHGVVSDGYHIIQNAEAFDFVKYIAQDVNFVAAGETATGLNYLIGALPSIKILDDDFIPHFIFQNSFNKRYICKVAIMPLRIVCQNQFNMAFKESGNTLAIRHSGTAAQKMELAQETMARYEHYMREFATLAEKFATISIGPDKVDAFIDYIFPIKTGINNATLQRLEIKRADLRRCVEADDNSNFRKSAWGLINAYTDFATHYSGTNVKKHSRMAEKRFERSVTSNINTIVSFVESLAA